MFSRYLIWFRRLLILGAVIAGATAATAGAVGHPSKAGARLAAPDVLERYAAAHPFGAGQTPDVLERYAAAHPYGAGATPDVLERYATAHPYGNGLATPDSLARPDLRDPAAGRFDV